MEGWRGKRKGEVERKNKRRSRRGWRWKSKRRGGGEDRRNKRVERVEEVWRGEWKREAERVE